MDTTNFTWELQRYEKGRYTPIVSITSKGVMGLSVGLISQFKKHNNKDAKSIKLFYDRAHRALALVPVYDDVEGAWPLKPLERGGAQVVINRFIKQNTIEVPSEVQRYEPKKAVIPGEEDGWFIVLSEATK